MHELEIDITLAEPTVLLGVRNSNLKLIRLTFPKIKLVARGSSIKAFGEQKDLDLFQTKMEELIAHVEKYNQLSENDIERVLGAAPRGENTSSRSPKDDDGVLVYGNNGIRVKARTANQRLMVTESVKNDMLFAIGPAGTGKTYTAVALAVRALKKKEVRRIVLTRPAVEAGENLGFLPGDMKEKLDPYMMPLYDGLRDMIHHERLAEYLENGTIEIAPLAFMRGRTLDNAFVILDEAQNTTVQQMKMFLTRMGKHAKFIITGDASQVDLPRSQKSGLVECIHILSNVDGISMVRLNTTDVVRHPLVKKIIKAFETD
ncbi:MAG: PhoH family protein [Flavobacteriales bacterium]